MTTPFKLDLTVELGADSDQLFGTFFQRRH